jgi:hypothetical protein
LHSAPYRRDIFFGSGIEMVGPTWISSPAGICQKWLPANNAAKPSDINARYASQFRSVITVPGKGSADGDGDADAAWAFAVKIKQVADTNIRRTAPPMAIAFWNFAFCESIGWSVPSFSNYSLTTSLLGKRPEGRHSHLAADALFVVS